MSHDVLIVLITAALGAAGWGVVQLWSYVQDLKKDNERVQHETASKVIEETQKNTLAIVELTVQMRFLTEKLAPLPKIEKDVNALHEWRRTVVKMVPGAPETEGNS